MALDGLAGVAGVRQTPAWFRRHQNSPPAARAADPTSALSAGRSKLAAVSARVSACGDPGGRHGAWKNDPSARTPAGGKRLGSRGPAQPGRCPHQPDDELEAGDGAFCATIKSARAAWHGAQTALRAD